MQAIGRHLRACFCHFLPLAPQIVIVCLLTTIRADAGVVQNFSDAQLGGGFRWDAAPRSITISGTPYERSLVGGLRYSVQGGSFQAYRDLFSWSSVPSVSDFQNTVQQAFDAWKAIDPVSKIASPLYFVPDLSTAVVGGNTGSGGVNNRGAEIDLFGSNDAAFWNVGSTSTQAETHLSASSGSVTLTSGTANYSGSNPITGVDIIVNSNSVAVYNLDIFRRLLMHEIGHALGLGDVEGNLSPGAFIDDNYDGSSSATALATLTNSWSALVNVTNPAASPLQRYTVPFANPGTTTPGVNILMESNGLGISAANPITNLFPLSNDDYGTRQFLYPGSILGDVNFDHIVNQLDLNVVFGNWLATNATLLQGDSNSDGVINQIDINTITGNWLATLPAMESIVTVPEPTAAMLLCVGVIGLASLRRRRQTKA